MPKYLLNSLSKLLRKELPLSVINAYGKPNSENTWVSIARKVVTAVASVTGRYKVYLVKAQITTKIWVNPPDIGNGPLWSA